MIKPALQILITISAVLTSFTKSTSFSLTVKNCLIIVLPLIAGTIFLVYRNNSTKTESTSLNQNPVNKDNLPSDQPNDSPQSPIIPTSERKERVRQLLAEGNEFLLKTNPKLVPIPDDFIGELLEKGYKSAVIKSLEVIETAEDKEKIKENTFFFLLPNSPNQEGNCSDLVVIVQQIQPEQNGPIINIDGRIISSGPEIPYIKEIVKQVLIWETDNPNQWQVSILIVNDLSVPQGGKSGGTALYLGLLSALYKKPLPNDLASSGCLEIKKREVSGVASLKAKIEAAFNKGVKNFQNKEVIFEIDQLASKSDKSILCRYGNTTVLSVLTVKQLTKNNNSFFPLTITFEEKFYAIGRIPNAFGKREGKPSYDAITSARLIDRSLRSFFPTSGNQEVQINNSNLPYFHTPLAAVIVGQSEDNFVCNPSNEKLNNSPLELIVSATEEKIVMLESGAQEISSEELAKAIEFAHREIQLLIADKIRPLEIQIDYLPNVHGSAVFARGETKVLSVVTIVNEIASYRSVSRREIGHGELVEKTFDYLIPHNNIFPYTVRVVSEVLSSDGSSSQASICATSLALMTAGIPLLRPAAGIALGLFEGQIYTDINGLEDKLGEMDFKIAGTEKGICSVQLDVKNQGISPELLKECLEKSQRARLYLLEEMKKYIFHPRLTLPAQVIKCRRFYVGQEKIGLVIGPRGKTINQLTEKNGTTIEVQNDGHILIYHQEEEELEATFRAIQDIIRGR
nr:6552_t:CDS:2 [Entrophospora candida]